MCVACSFCNFCFQFLVPPSAETWNEMFCNSTYEWCLRLHKIQNNTSHNRCLISRNLLTASKQLSRISFIDLNGAQKLFFESFHSVDSIWVFAASATEIVYFYSPKNGIYNLTITLPAARPSSSSARFGSRNERWRGKQEVFKSKMKAHKFNISERFCYCKRVHFFTFSWFQLPKAFKL